MDSKLVDLFLKPGEDRRLRAGHLWVFSNEVDVKRSPLGELVPGAGVVIRTHDGKPIGCGYANPHSLICARLVSRSVDRPLDESLFVHRFKVALGLRLKLYEQPFYRLIHGEGDGLPGLVVDRFGDLVVVQINTAGMECRRDAIVFALNRVIKPKHILLRADAPVRGLEGLELYIEWAEAEGPQRLTVSENGCRFEAPSVTGQKTGWYYDHTFNRRRLRPYSADRRVLDLYSYAGAWGIEAAKAGARAVMSVDASAEACEWVAHNANLNGVADRVGVTCGDALEVLTALRAERERFDLVIADPPAFIKRRKDLRKGTAAYERLNRMAMQLLAKDGVLISASCSAHLDERDFTRALLRGGRHLDRSLQVLEYGQQGPDHPVHPAIPETRYIKTLFARVLPAESNP